MAHDPSKLKCNTCNKAKSTKQDGVEIGRRCKLDGKEISFWGEDKCPKTEIKAGIERASKDYLEMSMGGE